MELFSPFVISKGFRLLHEDKVLTHPTPNVFTVVGDHARYIVRTDGHTYGSCQCPHGRQRHRQGNNAKCSHLVAVLLALRTGAELEEIDTGPSVEDPFAGIGAEEVRS